jgi:hypothetical protein
LSVWNIIFSFAVVKLSKIFLAYGNPGHKITPKHVNGAATLQFKREQERHVKLPLPRRQIPQPAVKLIESGVHTGTPTTTRYGLLTLTGCWK